MSDIVTIDINCGIADVRLNRPEKYNALSGDMFNAIIEAGESCLLYTSPSPRDGLLSRMPSSA